MQKTWLYACILLMACNTSFAQERYDDIPLQERFNMTIGGLSTNNYSTSIRVDSRDYGVGTIIRLEDNLKVKKSLDTARITGFYRFNQRHRLQWSYYQSERQGRATIADQPIQIGDNVYQVGSTINSSMDSKILQLGWSYSLINVQKYEFFFGAGLNIRQTTLAFDGNYEVGNTGQNKQGSVHLREYLPLPTVNLGVRYNFTPKLAVTYRFETFAIEYSDFGGMLKNTYLNLEYNAFKHVGFGIGVNSMMMDLEVAGDKIDGELESSYLAGLFYLKAYF